MPFIAATFYTAQKRGLGAMLDFCENKILNVLIGLRYVPNNQGKEPDRPILLERNQNATTLSMVVFKR